MTQGLLGSEISEYDFVSLQIHLDVDESNIRFTLSQVRQSVSALLLQVKQVTSHLEHGNNGLDPSK